MPRKLSNNPTVADVARACGVGTMTVSRVVNGGKLVSAATAARVREVIAKLGYEPNEAARILKGQASRTIGLIVPDLADPFFSTCAHAIQQMAAKHGYMTLLLASERDREREAKELMIMKSRNIAGILIVPSDASCVSQLQGLRAKGVPIVMLDRTFPGLNAGEVMVENDEGTRKAVNHLVEHGHRTILCVGYDSQFNSISQRITGYKRAMKDAGLEPQFVVVGEDSAIRPSLMNRLRGAKRPTALFTLNNVTTTHVLHILQRESIQVPEEIAIIGFDDFELASLLAVPLTAVRQPAAELGRSATRMLLEWVRSGGHDGPAVSSRVVLPTELIIRRSCGCQRIPKIAAAGRHSRSSADSIQKRRHR
jgi:LacI family transcriptional regulator